jgi:hypothetical protein
MTLGRALRPKEPRNLKLTALLSVLMLLAYLVASYLRPWSPKRGMGLVFGIVATVFFLFEMAYPWRRPKAWVLGTAKRWLQAHVYLGFLALLAVLLHGGLAIPKGTQGVWLLALTVWTTATGLLGVLLQKWIPVALSENLRVEALYDRIPALVAGLVEEADALMKGTSDVLDRFYRTEARPLLARLRPSAAFFLDVRGGRDRALEPFRRISQFVDAAEKDKINDLMAIYVEKVELDAHYSLQGVLRRWLVLHVPPAAALMALMVVHIVGWLVY